MIAKYKTLSREAEIEIIEKRSRFIACAAPAADEAAAREFIDMRRKKHPEASHNVYAYRLGFHDEIQKMSDDGEPGGTAGMPTLEALRAGDIKNAVIVVTRYFGGTLLGAGGLTRAYGKAARESAAAADAVWLELHRELLLTIDYGSHKKITHHAEMAGYVINGSSYSDVVTLNLLIKDDNADARLKEISDLTGGRASARAVGYCYRADHGDVRGKL